MSQSTNKSLVFKQFKNKLPRLIDFDQYAPKPSMINEIECLITKAPNGIYKYNLITKELTTIETTQSFCTITEHTNFFYQPQEALFLFNGKTLIKYIIDFKKNMADKYMK